MKATQEWLGMLVQFEAVLETTATRVDVGCKATKCRAVAVRKAGESENGARVS